MPSGYLARRAWNRGGVRPIDTPLLVIQSVQVEKADQRAPGNIEQRAQEAQAGGLGGGVDKQQRAPIPQALQGEGLLAALDVAGEGAVGKAAAALLVEYIHHPAVELPWA